MWRCPSALLPPGDPFGTNSALYRYDANTSALTALVTPETNAPGGGQFVGVFFGTRHEHPARRHLRGLVSCADIDPNNPPGVDGIGLGLFKVHA